MKITITTADILKNRDSVSMSGQLIDELAYSAGEATQDDLYEWDDSHIYDYVAKQYGYERALLDNTKTAKNVLALSRALGRNQWSARDIKEMEEEKHAGAYIALTYDDAFTAMLEEYTAKLKDEMYNYYDSSFLTAYAPDFAKELQEAQNAKENQNYKEWLYGDHRNYVGVLSLIAKYYGASERLTYDEKTGDSVVFTFDDEEIASLMRDYNGDENPIASETEAKDYLIHQITSSIDAEHNKKTAENAKRKAERERLTAYKAEQKAQADAERRAKLEALTK